MTKYNNWRKDQKASNKAILSISKTVLPKLISGKIHNVEDSTNEMLLMLDRTSGVDLIRQNHKGLDGIAVRVQFRSNYKTFTIRSKRFTGNRTELIKRKEQINDGYLYPKYTIQAYFDDREALNLKSIAIIKTNQLYHFIDNYPKFVHFRKSDNLFCYCYWSDLYRAGCEIKGYELINGQIKDIFNNAYSDNGTLFKTTY